ncbi:MAG: hypothetical protein ICV66_07945 [Chitinophagaceae bacterium]|nr:hypothetical protein [Chitinophagaceae bacterium]
MKKCSICSLAVILILLIPEINQAQSVTLIKTTQFNHFPSASALLLHNNQLYVFGDDAKYVLILDSDQVIKDSILLFPAKEKRMSKNEKPDIEAATKVSFGNKTFLLGIPSFSTPKRNRLVAFPLETGKKHKIVKLTRAEELIKRAGVNEVNIEGAAAIDHFIVLSNRANNTNKENVLLVIDQSNKNWNKLPPHSIAVQLPQQKNVLGISDLSYLKEKDLLLFTASTEATTSATSDGEIGESYLGYITNTSQKLGEKIIKPDKLINLARTLKIGKEKIEAISVEQFTGNELILHLAADNDDGKSSLFKIKMDLE